MGVAVVGAALPSGCGHPSSDVGDGGGDMAFPTVYTVYERDGDGGLVTLKASEIAVNDFYFATGPGVNINICRDAMGLFAQDADCTHAQCLLELNLVMPPTWNCNCHGSKFDFVGNVLNPPAVKPLVHYQLTVNADGSLTFDLSKIVDPTTRAMG
jgi:Rieske Fe-S protein